MSVFRSCRRKSRLTIILCLLLVMVVVGSATHFLLALSSSKACSDDGSIKYLKSLCSNYTAGIIAGTICKPLCITREIKFRRCLGHGVKLYVLEAEWNGNKVVLKTPKALGTSMAVSMTDALLPSNTKREDVEMSVKRLIYHVERYLHFNLVKGNGGLVNETISGVARSIASECDVGNDEVFSYWELVTCWQLISTEEYVLSLMLEGNAAILEAYGTCGNMYAVEYATSEPFLGFQLSLSDERSWDLRAQLALALLDMIEALENTVFGTLYLCDVQESNYGVVKGHTGKLKAKAIDVDAAMFESVLVSALSSERDRPCRVDDDCFMFRCGSKCNRGSGKCTGILTSSNLATMCSRILRQRYRLHAALLNGPPHHLEEKLNLLLEKCSVYGHTHIDKHLISELRHLLEQR